MFNLKTTGPVEAAQNEVTRLFTQEQALTDKHRAKAVTVAQFEGSAGERYLESGGTVEAEAESMIRARTEALVIEQAIEVTRRRRVAAIENTFRSEAAGLRNQALSLRSDAEALRRKSEPLLKKLGEIEGVTYTPAILLAQRTGAWLPDYVFGRALEDCNPAEGQADIGGGFAVPRSRALQEEAATLDRQAAGIEQRTIDTTGELTKPTVAELITELQADPQRLTPAVFAIEAWAAKIERQVERDRPQLLAPRITRRYHLNWTNGLIDPTMSSLTFVGVNHGVGDPVFTVAA